MTQFGYSESMLSELETLSPFFESFDGRTRRTIFVNKAEKFGAGNQ